MSIWKGSREFTNAFLALGFGHMPQGSPRMYRVEEVIHNGVVGAILAHFTNNIDAFYLLDRVFWCGCEFIAFTTHNIFTDYNNILPTVERCTLCRTASTIPRRRRSSEGCPEDE
ncbi:hypothetical protein D1007_13683 [Hordeum vulgare]|nr:hypothetical protein D1007_13683 [Hordeum vulgare]